MNSFAAVEATTLESSRRRSIVSVGSGGVARSHAIRVLSRRLSTLVASVDVSEKLLSIYDSVENRVDAIVCPACINGRLE